jgi:uncharacterized membrane protein
MPTLPFLFCKVKIKRYTFRYWSILAALTLRVLHLKNSFNILNVRAISRIAQSSKQKNGGKKMNVNFESSKTLAGEGSILLLLGVIPYVGWVLGIVGIVLLLKATREFSNYYQDEEIYRNTWTGLKYYIIALIAASVAIAVMIISFASAGIFTGATFPFAIGFGVGLIALFAGLITAFVFYVLAASHLRRTFALLAEKSGEASFTTAGTLLWWGSIFTILLVGLLLIFIAWIFATIGFFTMKPRQYQSYTQPSNGYTPPTQPETGNTTQTSFQQT